jgi:hypothetical protein
MPDSTITSQKTIVFTVEFNSILLSAYSRIAGRQTDKLRSPPRRSNPLVRCWGKRLQFTQISHF